MSPGIGCLAGHKKIQIQNRRHTTGKLICVSISVSQDSGDPFGGGTDKLAFLSLPVSGVWWENGAGCSCLIFGVHTPSPRRIVAFALLRGARALDTRCRAHHKNGFHAAAGQALQR